MMEPSTFEITMDKAIAIELWEACAEGGAGGGSAFSGIATIIGVGSYRLKRHPEDENDRWRRRRAARFLRLWSAALDVPEQEAST